MKKVLVIAVALTLVLSAMAFAGNNPEPKVAVHVRVHNAKAGCTVGPFTSCADIVTTEPGFSFDAFPVFFNLNEFLGCDYGLCWPTWTYGASFTACSDFNIGTIVNPGDGSSATWTSCQYGFMVPSYVWLYADGPGMVCPCPDPDGFLQVLDCAQGLDDPICIFCAGVYGYIGDDPCEPTGTSPSTWSEIKGMFE